MGLICPCGTVSDVEERQSPKTSSAGCSTQPRSTGRHGSRSHDKRSSASSKKQHLVSKEEETRLIQEVDDTPQSRGISCTPGEIQKISHLVEKTTREKPRRSRSASSHRGRVNPETERLRKHRRRHHSTDGKQREKKSVLPTEEDQGQNRGYGGTDLSRKGDTKVAARDLDQTDRKKKHGEHRSKNLQNGSGVKGSGGHRGALAKGDKRQAPPKDVLETPDIIKGKKKPHHTDPRNRVKYMGTGDSTSINTSFRAERLNPPEPVGRSETTHAPLENGEKPFKDIGNQKHRKPRSKPPAYVIPIAAMLE